MPAVAMFPNMTFCVCPANSEYVMATPKYDLKVYCGHCKQSHFVAACKEVPYEVFKQSVQKRSLGRVQRRKAARATPAKK